MEPEGNYEAGKLVRHSVRALKWSYAGVAARILLQLVAQIALARLLGPAAFGVVMATLPVIFVATIFADLGLGSALVQARSVERADIQSAFTRVLLTAAALSAAVAASADLFAALYGNPEVAPILRGMTLAILLQAAGVVPLALLKRRLDFKTIQLAQVGSYFVGYFVVGVGCAFAGFGAWSLVAAWLAQTSIASAIAYARAPHPLTLRWRAGPTPIAGYGLRTVVASIGNWGCEYADNLLVGRAYGTTALGVYSLSYNLVRTPVNHVVVTLQQVFMPFTARAQDDHATVRVAYHTLLWAVMLMTAPAFIGLGVVADTAVLALYGGAWRDAAPVLLPLALAMPLQAVQAVGGPVLWGSGEVQREIEVSFAVIVLLVVVLTLASFVSVVAMAWGLWCVYLVRAIWITARVSKLLGTTLARSLSMLAGGIVVGLLTAAVLYAAVAWMESLGLRPIVRLPVAVAIGAALVPLVVLALARVIVPPELRPALGYVLQRVPPRARRWLEQRFAFAPPPANGAGSPAGS